jgi:protein-S-isoprenylcysteine O-methyltransferase Ste14
MRIPPPLIALAAAAGQRALTRQAPPPGAGRKTAAAATAVASVALLGSAAQSFRASGTTVDPLHPERASALVASGPFAITRNPMYVGMAGLLVAHSLVRGSTRALLPAAAFVAVIDRVQIPPEEAAMAALFGAEYATYRSRVPRWIGAG